MPAKSAAQQKAAGAALAAKRGETSPSSLKGAAKELYSSMSEQDLEEFASTNAKGKPKPSPNIPLPPENDLIQHSSCELVRHLDKARRHAVIVKEAWKVLE